MHSYKNIQISILLLISFSIISNIGNCQKFTYENNQKDTIEKKSDEDNSFYYYEMPASINGSNIDVTPISNISTSFTDSKLSIKLGFPKIFGGGKCDSINPSNLSRFTGFVGGDIKASNGVSTIFKSDEYPIQGGASAGINWMFSHYTWKVGNLISSESVNWLNIQGGFQRGKYIMLNENEDFGMKSNEIFEWENSVFISVNRYYMTNTKLKGRSMKKLGFILRPFSAISSFGIGYAKTNNYSSLNSRELQEGSLYYSSDSTTYETVVKTTTGKTGEFIVYEGFAAYAELYIPIVRNPKWGSIFWGVRGSLLASKNAEIVNGLTGFFFTLKKGSIDNKPCIRSAEDAVNFSISLRMNNLQNVRTESNFSKNNASVQVQASIPLKFN